MNTSELHTPVDGPVLLPGDEEYERARTLWNARFDRRPELVVQCLSLSDVAAAVRWAVGRGLPVAVRGGGHSYAGHTVADGGMLLDMSGLSGVKVRPEEKRVAVQAGATWAELDAATQYYGLAATGPTVSSVGVAGSMLGGGTGWLSRAFGHGVDNLVSLELVTMSGETVTASPETNSELFWGLRGAGHNLGVVTALELALHDVGPEVLAGQVIYPFDDAERMLAEFAEFMRTAPDDFQCLPFTFRVPPIDAFPAEYHGQPVLDFVVFHTDPTALQVVAPLRKLGTPILDTVGPARYTDVQQSFDPNLPGGARYYSTAHDLTDLTEAAIADFAQFVRSSRGALTASYVEPKGGACSRVDTGQTAMGGRDAGYGFHVIAGWLDPAEDAETMAWAHEFGAAMSAHATGGVYVNLIAEDESQRIPNAFSDADRVARLKRTWDPANLLRANHNVEPARSRETQDERPPGG
jgi:FAD/FMN-containing dehydrogenase